MASTSGNLNDPTGIEEALTDELDAVERELERAVKTIQAEHRFKAAQGGAPCSCEYCRSTPTEGREAGDG